jgi:hypothetical protein
MFQDLFRPAADYWLFEGNKYKKSAELVGECWDTPIADVLAQHGLSLEGCTTPEAVADVFRGHVHWRPDALLQLWDTIDPPEITLAYGGEDCDGIAMLHAQACEHALGPLGWKSYIVSYYANPWPQSHHYAAVVDPKGQVWVMQPQPKADQDPNQQVVFGPYSSIEKTTKIVASWYNATVDKYDVRTPKFELLPA